MPVTADIVIVGGGVIGCSVAYHLALLGLRCIVVEREGIASAASGVAAGMLNVEIEHPESPLFALGVASAKLFPNVLKVVHENSGIDPEFMSGGTLRLAFTEQEERALRALMPLLKPHMEVDWVNTDDALRTEPLLSDRIRGGLYTPLERQVRPARLTQAFAQAAAAEGRVSFQLGQAVTSFTYMGSRITGVRLADGSHISCDHVVLAAGPWSGLLAEELGVQVPVRPVRGQIVTLYRMPRPLRTSIHGRGGYLTPKVDGTVLAGATQEEAGFDRRLTASGVGSLLTMAPELAPELANAEVRDLRVGLRPGTPDGCPILGPVPGWEGITLATGHFRSGILLSPITGLLIAQHIAGQDLMMSIEPFSVTRFD